MNSKASDVAGAAMTVSWTPGRVTVAAPSLFALTAHADVRRFVERVLHLDPITSVVVEFAQGRAMLNFDDRQTNVSQLLRRLGEVLDQQSAGIPPADYLVIDPEPDRKIPRWTGFRPIRQPWQITTRSETEFGICGPLLDDEPTVGRSLSERLSAMAEVKAAACSRDGKSIDLTLRSRGARSDRIERLMQQATEQTRASYWADLQEKTTVRVVVHGLRRIIYVTLAFSGFVMMIVALILPGIPTPPFLIATTYFGAKSSPAFYAWLCQTALFGRMVLDWRDHRAFRFEDKLKSIVLTLFLIAIGATLLEIGGALLGVVLTFAAIEIVWLLLVPEILVPVSAAGVGVSRLAFP